MLIQPAILCIARNIYQQDKNNTKVNYQEMQEKKRGSKCWQWIEKEKLMKRTTSEIRKWLFSITFVLWSL
ncbi:hypothetical protein NC651_010763 [Populus alba x Populus x berolinensis]|nr:hypothetical protein NC651_010763 [Populus alba x Populus x berolinensis]